MGDRTTRFYRGGDARRRLSMFLLEGGWGGNWAFLAEPLDTENSSTESNSSESLTLEKAIEVVKKSGLKVYKEM